MRDRFRIRTVIGYVAESLRYADTIEEARRKADEQHMSYPGCDVFIEDRESFPKGLTLRR